MSKPFTEFPESADVVEVCLIELIAQWAGYKGDRAAYAEARRNTREPNYMATLEPLYQAYLDRIPLLKEAHAEYKTAFRNLRQCKQL